MKLRYSTNDIKNAINETLNKKNVRRFIKEAMYRNMPGEGEDFPPFNGRRPKTVKARINQIYNLVNKYGLSSRKYTDDHWQATDDYDRILTHLGYEVHWDVKNGGYGDYRDGMPMSKTYDITLVAEDGMEIAGYIKCMAAGSNEDPFDAYDTCMVLWNKPKRNYDIAESITNSAMSRILREWDADDPDEDASDYAYSESPHGEFEGIYDLDNGMIYHAETAPDIEIGDDNIGGEHRYVHFWASPDDYNITDEEPSEYSPGVWECNINGYDISTDGKVYNTSVDSENGVAYYDDEVLSGEQFDGFTEEEERQIKDFLDKECDANYWNFN